MNLELDGIVTLLEVCSVPASIKFYSENLGFDVIQRAGTGEYVGWAWLRKGNVDLMLNAMFESIEDAKEPDRARMSAHRDTTLYIGCRDVDGAYEFLRTNGVSLKPPTVAHYEMRQLYFTDPDGYGICLQWPSQENTDSSRG
jgi:glyoxylase I family protein